MSDTHNFHSPVVMDPEELTALGITVESGDDIVPATSPHKDADTTPNTHYTHATPDVVHTSNWDEHEDNINDDTLEDDDYAEEVAPDDRITFADLGLPTRVLDALDKLGFVIPTPIQAASIPALLDGKDVVGIAQTGTGKTAAFGLPMLAGITASDKHVQALVLAPTRELAMQSAQAMENFADLSRGIDVVPVYGGSAYGPQINALKKGAQIVVGTPGRVIDLIEKGALDLTHVRYFVLDEADEMLRMGFAEDVETITETVPEDRLTALFSATMPPAIEKIAATHLTNPVKIEVTAASSTVDTITQTYAVVPYKHKIGALGRVLAVREADAAIVFVRTRMDVEEISLEMAARGFRAAGISGDVAQAERERLVERLRKGTLDVLVATDVAARGLDVERIGLVVNFDVPREPEAYVHRIGRTGRAGREGLALTFFTPKESYRLRRIEKLTGTKMEEVQIPSPAAVSEFRSRRLLDGLSARVERGRLDLYKNLLSEVVANAQALAQSSVLAREEAQLAIEEAQENNDLEAFTAAEAALASVPTVKDISLLDIAAALMAQAVGDEGPAPRVEKDRRGSGKTRREETLDENGEFASAVFEGGRDKGDKPRSERTPRGSRAAFGRRYRVEVGKKDGVAPGAIVGAITGEGGIKGKDLGRIEIFPTFSLVEIDVDMDEDTLARIGRAHVQGRPLRIREDRGAPSSSSRGDRSSEKRRDTPREREVRFERRQTRIDERGGRHNDEGARFERHDRADRTERSARHEHGERRFGGARGTGKQVHKSASQRTASVRGGVGRTGAHRNDARSAYGSEHTSGHFSGRDRSSFGRRDHKSYMNEERRGGKSGHTGAKRRSW